MKKLLILMCALLVAAGCSSQRNLSQQQTKDATMMAYVWQNGRPESARVDWNRPWTPDQQQYAQGGTSLGTGTSGAGVTTGEGVTTGGGGLEKHDQADLELHKEELVVGKREVSNGGVLIRKKVETENVNQSIDLRREEYVIERVPADQASNRSDGSTNASYDFQKQEIYIPLMREEPVTSKRILITEKVHVGKRTETDRQTITRPVRSEDVEIVKNPDLSDQRFSGLNQLPSPSYNAAQGGTSAAGQTGVTTSSGSSGVRQEPERITERDSINLNVAREELIVGKREVNNGGVLLRKTVRTQDSSQPIDLKREEFAIDRNPVSDQQVENADFREREIQINLTREEPVVGTRSLVTEVIRVRKKSETDHQTVAGTVRKETLEVVKNGDQSGRPTARISPPTEPAQGGTLSSAQSGAGIISDSGNPKITKR